MRGYNFGSSETGTADKERVAVHLFGGMAAEILKLNDFDYNARIPDIRQFNGVGCTLTGDYHLQQASAFSKNATQLLFVSTRS